MLADMELLVNEEKQLVFNEALQKLKELSKGRAGSSKRKSHHRSEESHSRRPSQTETVVHEPVVKEPEVPKLGVKFKFRGEYSKIQLPRNASNSVDWPVLDDYFAKQYGRRMNMYYTYRGSNFAIALMNQKELDTAVQMVDRSGQRNLCIILSQHEPPSTPSSLMPDESGKHTIKVLEVPNTNNTPDPIASAFSDVGSALPTSSSSSQIQPMLPINWRVGRCLGRGAFGEVCIAYDVDLSRDVALKKIYITQDEASRRDVHSIETDVIRLSQLKHKRLVTYLGVSKTHDLILIFMEYMVGGSVKDLLLQFGTLGERAAEKYTRQVLEGLEFLHGKLIAHRDIKPANLLRDQNGNIKIGDFGSAKQLQALASCRGSCGGTPHYLAPEVVLGEREAGRRADIWSLGVTLVEMLTGEVPYKNLPDIEATLKIAFEESQCQLPDSISEKLHTLTRQLMTKDYNSRPRAQEVLDLTPWNKEDLIY